MMRLHICALIPLKSSEMAELWTQLMFNFSCRERERKRERGRGGGVVGRQGDVCKVNINIRIHYA